MYIKQLYTDCLAQAAYYVESAGEALVIDPLRDPLPYIELANKRKAKIKYIFETHFHADFVSGHQEISRKTAAVIVYGPEARPAYQALIACDNEEFQLGKIKMRVLHTPGHTVESSSFLLIDENDKPYCVFTGDTLFVGDVGRPDLLSGKLSKEVLASLLFDSLNTKIKTLPDDVIVYPGHGAGSACGKNIGKETFSTIGEQKKTNYALKTQSRFEFIRAVTSGLPSPPPYFFKDAAININGYNEYALLFKREKQPLSVTRFKDESDKGALILDTRPAAKFAKGFIAGSVNVGLNGDFAVWVGTVIPFEKSIILVAEPGNEQESITRLARIGYDNVQGYLDRGIAAWNESGLPLEKITSVRYDAVENGSQVLDVRRDGENENPSLRNAIKIPLAELESRLSELNKSQTYVVCCAGGYRSMVAISIMRRHGFKNTLNLEGGVNAYRGMIAAA